MIQENEIYYDKRTHRPYIAKIVGSELAYMRYVPLDWLTRGMCNITDQIANSKYDTLIVKDLQKLCPLSNTGKPLYWEIPVFRIGQIGQGNCGNVFLTSNALTNIEKLRAKDNWTGEPSEKVAEVLSPKVNMDTVGERVVKAVNKTAKKKKKPIKKTILGINSDVIPVPNIKAVPKKATKKVIVKKPKNK